MLVEGKHFILMRSKIDGIAKGETILFFRLRRRVQLVIRRFQRSRQITVERGKHCFTAFGQMRIVCNDGIHRFAHHRKDEIAVRGTRVHLFFTDVKCSPTAREIVKVQPFVFLAELRHIVVVVINDGAKLVRNS